MFNLQLCSGISEGKAMGLIFDACRANPNHNDWKNADGYSVQFKKIAGRWLALLRDKWGGLAASDGVDEFDV